MHIVPSTFFPILTPALPSSLPRVPPLLAQRLSAANGFPLEIASSHEGKGPGCRAWTTDRAGGDGIVLQSSLRYLFLGSSSERDPLMMIIFRY